MNFFGLNMIPFLLQRSMYQHEVQNKSSMFFSHSSESSTQRVMFPASLVMLSYLLVYTSPLAWNPCDAWWYRYHPHSVMKVILSQDSFIIGMEW